MKRYQPALLGGLFIGVLSLLPGINLLNVCCCLWVITGGVLTTYLLQQNDPLPLETSVAALGGLLAGALGGLIQSLGGVVMMSLGGEAQRQSMQDMMEAMGEMPPEAAAMFERLTSGPLIHILGGAITVPVYAVFGLLGGLLGLAFFRNKMPPAAPAPDLTQTPTLR
ncbi:MAG: hypothetical protein AB7L71_03950 [Vicinamibacterales bacterium]